MAKLADSRLKKRLGQGRPRTAYRLCIHPSACDGGGDIYHIARDWRTSVEMIGKYYAAHIKTSLDAVATNVTPAPILCLFINL